MPAGAAADAGGSPVGGAFADLGGAHACAVQRDRSVRCWGKGSSGRLGSTGTSDLLSGAGGAPSAPPVGPVTAVSSGDAHTCALTNAATVRCWGQGGSGQLGGGSRDNRLDGAIGASGTDEATTVPLGTAVASISAGGDFTCAVDAAGTVRCWGDGAFGELGSRGTDNRLDGLGDGPTDDASAVPLGGPAVAVSAGPQHACALLATGVVRCWGEGGEGRLGSGGTDDRLDGIAGPSGTDEASVVPLAGPATAISAGGAHTCALLTSGAVSCWGAGFYGQTGAGRNDDRLDGAVVGTGAAATDAASSVVIKANVAQKDFAKAPALPVVAIATGEAHTCAVTTDGDVRCWGKGDAGQLGQGATDPRLENNATQVSDAATRVGGGPTALTGPGLGGPAVAVTAAYASSCATLVSGILRCWGSGLDGRLGSGASDARLDGIVDGASRTDDPSSVPIGPVAGNAGELAVLPEPGPAPPPVPPAAPPAGPRPPTVPLVGATPSPLSFKFKIKGRKATVAALLKPSKAGKCPTRARALARDGKRLVGKANLGVRKKGSFCRAAGTVRLRQTPKRRAGVVLTIRAKGVAARTLKPTR